MNKNQQINNIIKQLRNIINNEDVNEKTKYKASCKEVNSDYKTPKYQNIDLNRYQKINNTVSQYTSFDFKTNYGVGNIKNLFNHISTILMSQQETINKLEQSIREINKKLPEEINKNPQVKLLEEEVFENKQTCNNPFDDV